MSIIVPGRGWVFTAAPDTEAFDIAGLDIRDEQTFAGWDWLGYTSKENTVALTKEGGEATTRDTWEEDGVRSEKSPTIWGVTVNALSVTRETLQLAFPDGEWDDATQRMRVFDGSQTVNRAVLIVMRDSENGLAAFQFPNGATGIGEAPAITPDGFFEIQLSVTAQSSPANRHKFDILTPRLATVEEEVPEPTP